MQKLPAGKSILIYSDDPGIGGVAQFDHMLSMALAEQRYAVSLVMTKSESPLVKERVAAGVNHYWLGYNTVKDFPVTVTSEQEPRAIFAHAKPDLIFFSDSCPASNLAAKRVALEQGIPYVNRVGFVAPYLAKNFKSYLSFISEFYRKAHEVVAVSKENIDLLRCHFGLLPAQGRLIYTGKPERFFRRTLETRRVLREKLGVPDETVVYFTAARLETVKGFQYQIEAILRLKEQGCLAGKKFVWAGEGSLRAVLEDAISRHGLQDAVTLLGTVHNIDEWLDAADVFVLPAEAEGLPQAIIEAMAKGLPVVSTRVSGIPEALGEEGILLEAASLDPQAFPGKLAAELRRLGDNPAIRATVGKALHQRACAMFAFDRMVMDYRGLIDNALGLAAPLPARPASQDLSVRLVCYEEGWIFQRIANEMRDHLERLGVVVQVGAAPDPGAVVNHHINFLGYAGRTSLIDTVMFTHLDTAWKLGMGAKQVREGAVGICMSRATMDLLHLIGVDRNRLDFVNPGRNNMPFRRVRIAICTRLYPDGRKREAMVEELCEHISPKYFRFSIIGAGWEAIVARLHGRGFMIDHTPDFDRVSYEQLIETCDYYLYMGMDEGSMGFVDAVAAGVETIATPQGFHLDAPMAISHPFVTLDDLKAVFGQIVQKRLALVESVGDWTWEHYARRHLEIWSKELAAVKAKG